MEKKRLIELLGHEPSKGEKMMFLKEVQETGEPLEKVIDKYTMPPVYSLNEDGTLNYKHLDGTIEKMTPDEFNRRWPFRRFVTIRRRKHDKT